MQLPKLLIIQYHNQQIYKQDSQQVLTLQIPTRLQAL